MSCTVSADNEVTAVWKKNDNSQITLSPFVASSAYLYLTASAEAYAREYKGQERAVLNHHSSSLSELMICFQKFFLEPIN
ncbi:hypothetical protein M407DRAFT_104249 [Tulasnella calospora MUT 4182]|uniref:Uncharacterized protein n=1 Tax=Tulasnella calospora MUT 4182 TaxID=1051891 RepID=A0A0C3LRI2_9AGAM|nr:hypothetical protein M407DRAFT_104249 [Tulasnella calospora MUT 4182]